MRRQSLQGASSFLVPRSSVEYILHLPPPPRGGAAGAAAQAAQLIAQIIPAGIGAAAQTARTIGDALARLLPALRGEQERHARANEGASDDAEAQDARTAPIPFLFPAPAHGLGRQRHLVALVLFGHVLASRPPFGRAGVKKISGSSHCAHSSLW